MEQFLESKDEQTWYHAKINPVDNTSNNRVDVLVVSRYPILESYRIQGLKYLPYGVDKANSAHLIDLPNSENHLLLVSAHTPCCQSNFYREIELQEIMSFIRDAKSQGGVVDLELNTPIIISGDMNLVGPSHQKDILTEGDLIDNDFYGQDFKPDWDETSFADAKPFSTGFPGVITWYDESSVYSPGRLDYLVYSDYTINLINSYSLFTKLLPEDILQSHNLNFDDAMKASDHLPIVADFTLKQIVGVENDNNILPNNTELHQNYPNPFNPNTTISYSISESDFVQLKVYDMLGREVSKLVNEEQSSGKYKVEFDSSLLTSGIYFYRIVSGNYSAIRKMVILK